MTFKDSSSDFKIIDIALIEPDPQHPRQNIDEGNLKGLANSIQKKGVIHPLLVRPAKAAGRNTIVVGERRRQAAILAGEKMVPVVIRACSPEETLEVQVFENAPHTFCLFHPWFEPTVGYIDGFLKKIFAR